MIRMAGKVLIDEPGDRGGVEQAATRDASGGEPPFGVYSPIGKARK